MVVWACKISSINQSINQSTNETQRSIFRLNKNKQLNTKILTKKQQQKQQQRQQQQQQNKNILTRQDHRKQLTLEAGGCLCIYHNKQNVEENLFSQTIQILGNNSCVFNLEDAILNTCVDTEDLSSFYSSFSESKLHEIVLF